MSPQPPPSKRGRGGALLAGALGMMRPGKEVGLRQPVGKKGAGPHCLGHMSAQCGTAGKKAGPCRVVRLGKEAGLPYGAGGVLCHTGGGRMSRGGGSLQIYSPPYLTRLKVPVVQHIYL